MPFPNAKRGRGSRGSSLCTRTRARVPRECGIRERAAEPEREREREGGFCCCVEGCIEAIGDATEGGCEIRSWPPSYWSVNCRVLQDGALYGAIDRGILRSIPQVTFVRERREKFEFFFFGISFSNRSMRPRFCYLSYLVEYWSRYLKRERERVCQKSKFSHLSIEKRNNLNEYHAICWWRMVSTYWGIISKKKEKKERIRRYRILGSMNFVDIEVDNALL